MEIVLIRHGRTPSNEARRYLGRSDEPLSASGREQALALRERGVSEPEQVFTSPLKRCVQTAQIAFPECEPVPVAGFTEIDFGRFEGRTHDELMREEPAYAAWLGSNGLTEIPGGETQAQLRQRVRTAFLELVPHLCSLKRAAIVVHSGTIMALLAEFTDPPRAFYDCFIPNCGVVRCELVTAKPALRIVGGELV